MEFEWDDDKNRSNQLKHCISFEQAALIYKRGTVKFRTKAVEGENRSCFLGETKNGIVIFIVATQRSKRVRIISARRANRKEREFYYVNQKGIA